MSNYGYAKGFVLEYDHTLKKSVNCSDCVYYEKDDKSCNQTGWFIPEEGYNSWYYCEHFELSASVANYEKKKEYLKKAQNKKPLAQKKNDEVVRKTPANVSCIDNKKQFEVEKIKYKGELFYKIHVNRSHSYFVPCKEVRNENEAVNMVCEEIRKIKSEVTKKNSDHLD